MSIHPITVPDVDLDDRQRIVHRVWQLASAAFGRGEIDWDATPYALIFDPDLTAEEQTTLALFVSVCRSPVKLTRTEYEAVRTQMQTLRALRQLGRNAFMGLTEAERWRRQYDFDMAVTEILLAMTRD